MIEKADSKSDVKLLVTTTQAIKGYSVIIALLIAFLRLYQPRYVVFGSILEFSRGNIPADWFYKSMDQFYKITSLRLL